MTSLPCRPSAPLVTDRDVQALFEDGTPLRLEFQPQYDLRNGRLSSAEALARWSHPEKGDVPPADFMPAIHRLGLEQAFFERVCSLALDAIRVLNLPRHLHPDCDQRLRPDAGRSAQPGVPAARSAAAADSTLAHPYRADGRDGHGRPTRAVRGHGALRAWGCSGAGRLRLGYSNLAMLARLDIDELQLDRQLVARVDDSLVAREAVRFALALGERMGWRVVAEGISTSAEPARAASARSRPGLICWAGRVPISRLAALADAGRDPPCRCLAQCAGWNQSARAWQGY